MQQNSTRKLTLASIFTAMAVMLMIASSILPIGVGILFIIGSAMMCAIVCECGVRYALVGFTASAILTFILAPDKSIPLMYAAFTGWYPIVKLYIEKLRNIKKEFALKVFVGAVVAVISYFLAKLIGMPFEWYWIFIIAVAAVGYDFILSLMIQIYYEKIRKHIR